MAWNHNRGWRAFRFTTSRISQVAEATEMPFAVATSSGRNSSTSAVPSAPIRTGRVPITSKVASAVHSRASASSAIATAESTSARVCASNTSRSLAAAAAASDSFMCSILETTL